MALLGFGAERPFDFGTELQNEHDRIHTDDGWDTLSRVVGIGPDGPIYAEDLAAMLTDHARRANAASAPLATRRPRPAAQQLQPAVPIAPPTPDGPCEPLGFVWRGRSVDLAPLRYRLLAALWDSTTNRPYPAREVSDVMREVWGVPAVTAGVVDRGIVRNLVFQTRRALACANVTLTVHQRAGMLWLADNSN